MIKRLADFFEKFAVAALAIGMFQSNALAVIFGVCSFATSLTMTYWLGRLGGREK